MSDNDDGGLDCKTPAPHNALGLVEDWGGKMAAIRDCTDVDALVSSDDVEFSRLLYILQTLERTETFPDLMAKQLALWEKDLNNLNSPLADLIRKCAALSSFGSPNYGFTHVYVLPFVWAESCNVAHLQFFVRRFSVYKDEVACVLFQVACERRDAGLFRFLKTNQLVPDADARHNILYTRLIGMYINDKLRDLLAAEGFKDEALFVASTQRTMTGLSPFLSERSGASGVPPENGPETMFTTDRS